MTTMNYSASELWDSLAKSALLGTERAPAPLSANLEIGAESDALETVLSNLPPTSPEEHLLQAAALVAQYRRAGWCASVQEMSPLPAPPPEEKPCCSEAAALRLKTLLDAKTTPASRQYNVKYLAEWMRLASENGVIVPPHLTPRVLEWARTHSDYRQDAANIVGRQGQWLAMLNPQWQGIGVLRLSAGSDGTLSTQALNIEELWQTETTVRRELLSDLRLHQPDKARELLLTTWQQEKPDDRTYFLRTFSVNLTLDDEDFLESALNDKSKGVQVLATQYLAKLPQSRLVARMKKRAEAFLQFGDGELSLTLPDAFADAWARDGIRREKQGRIDAQNIGEKAFWLGQILALVPPSHWLQRWNTTPQKLMEAASRTEWHALLRDAWKKAASNTDDSNWLEFFQDKFFAQEKLYDGDWSIWLNASEQKRSEGLQKWFSKPASAERRLYSYYAWHHFLGLDGHARPYSEDFARAVIGLIREVVETRQARKYTDDLHQMCRIIQQIALLVPPSMLEEFAAACPQEIEDFPQWASMRAEAIGILEQRRLIAQELGSL